MGILQELHDSEINGSVSWFFDGQWLATLGDALNGIRAQALVASEAEAEGLVAHERARTLSG